MQRWTSRLAAAATAMVLAIGSVGCSDDDASRLVTQIFGNLLGSGEYSSLSVTVDQDVVGTLIDTTTCDIADALESCDVTITPGSGNMQVANGEILSSTTSSTLYSGPIQVTIDNCTDPIRAFSNLFRCVTVENAGEIEVLFDADATCQPGSDCEEAPQICVTSAGADDFCGETPPTTTVSTSSSTTTSNTDPPTTSTSTTSTTTTSTTLPQQATRCDITFSVTSTAPGGILGALSFNTVYPPTGNFDGSAAAVDCTALVSGVLPSFNNQEPNNTLLTGMIGVPGFGVPADVSQCTYLSNDGIPEAVDFAITVTDAATPDLSDVTATTTVEITEIACDDTPVTTTTSPSTSSSSSSTSTSSTLTTTTTDGGALAEYDVFFAIAEAATYGALQFTANYAAAPGGFIGSGAGVDCALVPAANTLNAFNDIEAESNLNIGIIALFGFTTSAGEQIVRCGFEGTSMPTAADFVVAVQDSSDTGGQPLPATITIGSIVPR